MTFALIPKPIPVHPTCITLRVFEPMTPQERDLARLALESSALLARPPRPLWRVVLCHDGAAWLTSVLHNEPPAIEAMLQWHRMHPNLWVELLRASA